MKRFVEVHYYIKDGKRDELYRKLVESGIADAFTAFQNRSLKHE